MKILEFVVLVLQVLSKLYASFHEQLPWIHELFGGTIDKLTAITYLLGHSAFLVLACFGILFVNAPRVTRVLLLVLVPLNCFTALHECRHLSYTQITWLLALSVPGKKSSFSSLHSRNPPVPPVLPYLSGNEVSKKQQVGGRCEIFFKNGGFCVKSWYR